MIKAQHDFTYEPLVPTVPFDLGAAREYFTSLPDSDVNKKYFNGMKYEVQTSLFARWMNYHTLWSKLHTLKEFYPH
jgi:hypothetical protein